MYFQKSVFRIRNLVDISKLNCIYLILFPFPSPMGISALSADISQLHMDSSLVTPFPYSHNDEI